MARGVVGDKWSSRILWLCALGSAVGSFFATTLLLKLIKKKMKKDTTCLYMVAVERQTQNRNRMIAESLRAMEGESGGEEV
ncbi:Pentatricopeptide repeat [Cinnamomum micranthum f. kanehirae]|uniref:Pentatricopeptide repeat n=1 Tax=Cinnamomum micranthum f. kanehirae TaxID=337451 RepID=A0A3S3NH86_9MAGN|nr:Pentatricopeptide repeat [Cinnamomum micranthum f. kanehirae]